jgi:hypothetical protein
VPFAKVQEKSKEIIMNSVQPNGTGGRSGARSGGSPSFGGGMPTTNEKWGMGTQDKGVTHNAPAGAKKGQNHSSQVPNIGPSGKSHGLGSGTQPNGSGGRTGGK